MKPVPIIIVSYNTLFYTRRCIESILVHSHFEESLPYRLIVVDNGSTDGTKEYLDSIHGPGCHWIIPLTKNVGWIRGVNTGLELSLEEYGPDYIIFSNSDIVVPGDRVWLNKYVEVLQRPDVGAVGPTSNFVMGLQKHQFNAQLPGIHEAKFLIGFFMAVKASVLREIGLLDERFGIGGNDDLDLSIRIRQAGYKLLINRRAFIYHYGSKTLLPFFESWKGIAEQEARTRALLVEKWGQETVNELFTMPEGVQGRLGGAGQGI